MENQKNTRTLGLIGTVLGLIALGVSLFHFYLGPIEKPPALETYVADKAVKLKDALSAKMRGEEYQEEARTRSLGPDRIVKFSAIFAGFLAIALGVMGFIFHEERRPSIASVVLGGFAIAFQLAILFVGILVVLCIVALVFGALS